MTRETRSELFLPAADNDQVVRACAVLADADFMAGPGDLESRAGGLVIPIMTIMRWRDDGRSDSDLVEDHCALALGCVQPISPLASIGDCEIRTRRGRLQWLQVVRSDSLDVTGDRILAADEADVDEQLLAYAELKGADRNRYTVFPRRGWASY